MGQFSAFWGWPRPPRKEGQELLHFQNLDEILTYVCGWKFVDFLKEIEHFPWDLLSGASRGPVLSNELLF
jgi:hypothetical protein